MAKTIMYAKYVSSFSNTPNDCSAEQDAENNDNFPKIWQKA